MSFLARLFRGAKPAVADDPALVQALARVLARVEPGIERTREWPGRYRAAIAAALAQARRVAEGIPGPVELDREHWVRNPEVHSLFAGADDLRRLLSTDAVLRAHVAAHGGAEVYAVLSMRREERDTFGLESAGETLRRDVAQRVVWFGDHRFVAAAAGVAEAREQLLWALFDRFLERLRVGLERLRAERDHLIREKDLAQARLRGAPPQRRAALADDFQARVRRLGEIGNCLDTGNLHEVFNTILSHPEDCLYLEQHDFRLDAMGVVQAEDGAADAATLRFVDLMERYQAPRTVVLARCRDIVPATLEERLREADRWL